MGYVSAVPDGDTEALLTGDYEVEVACERVPADVSLSPLYDPKNTQIRA